MKTQNFLNTIKLSLAALLVGFIGINGIYAETPEKAVP